MLNKANINKFFVIILISVSITVLGCGRKAPPTAPQKLIIKPVFDIDISMKNKSHFVFWKYKNDADFFYIDIAGIICESCPADYKRLGSANGNKRFFEFAGYKKGSYKIRVIAVKGRYKSSPVFKDFYIK